MLNTKQETQNQLSDEDRWGQSKSSAVSERIFSPVNYSPHCPFGSWTFMKAVVVVTSKTKTCRWSCHVQFWTTFGVRRTRTTYIWTSALRRNLIQAAVQRRPLHLQQLPAPWRSAPWLPCSAAPLQCLTGLQELDPFQNWKQQLLRGASCWWLYSSLLQKLGSENLIIGMPKYVF